MKKRSFLLAAALSASALLAGSSASAFAAEYAVILKTLANPFWQSVQDGALNRAKELGVEVDVFAATSEDDTQAQLQLFEDVLNRDYKGIIFAPISPVNLVQPVAAAWKAGIPLVNVAEAIDMASLKAAGGNVDAFITTDNVAVGEKAANFIIEQLGAEGGDVAIIEGQPGVAAGEARKEGAVKAFTAAPNINIVSSQPANWDRLKALDVAANILQSSPNLKAIYCANDTMALGAMQAVQNAGKEGEVIVVGTDGTPEALELVASGHLAATVAQDPEKLGADSLDLLIEAQKNRSSASTDVEPRQVRIDSVLITQ